MTEKEIKTKPSEEHKNSYKHPEVICGGMTEFNIDPRQKHFSITPN